MEIETTQTVKNRSKKLIVLCVVFTILHALSTVLYSLEEFDLPWIAKSVLMIVMGFLLCYSYCTHAKNVMKPMLGAILILFLAFELDYALTYAQYLKDLNELYPNDVALKLIIIIKFIAFAVMAIINLLHYSINASHHSSPEKVKANKVFYVLYVAVMVAGLVVVLLSDISLNVTLSEAARVVSDSALLYMVVVIEGSLDEYRIAREAKAAE